MALLQVKNAIKRFGGLTAVNDVSYEIEDKSISAIIGPNGAGKTTFFNLITGIYVPDEGTVTLGGRNLKGLRPDQINRAGISRTFQNIRLFGSMTVIENILVGMHPRLNISLFSTLLRLPGFGKQERDSRKKAEGLLEFVGLRQKANEVSRNLPYGEQRKLEIARALASDPKLILLDEPTAGMNPQESLDAMSLFRGVRDTYKVTVLLIEHDMKVVMGISEHIAVLDYGQKIAEGTPNDIKQNQRVIEAYLGKSAEGA
jgi:branched-chain amino acid transport system ATP-binding protein